MRLKPSDILYLATMAIAGAATGLIAGFIVRHIAAILTAHL